MYVSAYRSIPDFHNKTEFQKQIHEADVFKSSNQKKVEESSYNIFLDHRSELLNDKKYTNFNTQVQLTQNQTESLETYNKLRVKKVYDEAITTYQANQSNRIKKFFSTDS